MSVLSIVCLTFIVSSCIGYSNGAFNVPVGGTSTKNKKAYITDISISATASSGLHLYKLRCSGANFKHHELGDINSVEINADDIKSLKNYLNKHQPDIFTKDEAQGIPVQLDIDATQEKVDGSMLRAFLSGLTLQIIPAGIYSDKDFTLTATNMGDDGIETRANHSCKLHVSLSWGGSWSPFVWIGASNSLESTLCAVSPDTALMYHNYFETPEFAGHAARAISKLLNSLPEKSTVSKSLPKLEYPQACVADDAKKNEELTARRPSRTLTDEQLRMVPISANPKQFNLAGKWKGTYNSITQVKPGSILEFSVNNEYIFEDNGNYSLNVKTTGAKNLTSEAVTKGKWDYTPTNVHITAETTKSGVMKPIKHNGYVDKMVIRWYDKNTIELLHDNLDGFVMETMKLNPQIRSCDAWYDDNGNLIIKEKIQVTGNNMSMMDTIGIISGRMILKRQ